MVNRPHLAAWRVEADGPARMGFSDFKLEQQLENWIERDPSIVMDGIEIVGRQVHLEGGRLDLLGLDAAGRWIVIELKAGTLYREVLTQALDYAACIRTLPSDQLSAIVNEYRRQHSPSAIATPGDQSTDVSEPPREVVIIVVGTANDAGVERLADYLSSAGVQVRAVTLHALMLDSEHPVLIRQLTDDDVPSATAGTTRPRASVENVMAQATDPNVRALVRRLNDVAVHLGLYPRPYPYSIMYAPPQHHGRFLFTVWPGGDPRYRFFAGSDSFTEFFDVTLEQARDALGAQGWRELTDETVNDYIRGLQTLLTMSDHGAAAANADPP